MINIHRKHYIAKYDSNKEVVNVFKAEPLMDGSKILTNMAMVILCASMFGLIELIIIPDYNVRVVGMIIVAIISFVVCVGINFESKESTKYNQSCKIEKPANISQEDWDSIVIGMLNNSTIDKNGYKWFANKDNKKFHNVIKNANNKQHSNNINKLIATSEKEFDNYIEKKIVERKQIVQ